MTPFDILEELRRRDVDLAVDGENLHFRGPKGAVSPGMRTLLQANKAALLAHLRKETVPGRASKRFSLSTPRPPLSPLVDPGWAPDHAFAKWVERDKGYLLIQLRIARVFVRAEGVHMWTDDGERILDCLSQYGALPFGHNPPQIWDAISVCRGAMQPAFSANGFSDMAGALAERLIGLWPEAMFDGVVFSNSGAEALEAALKLARSATGRTAFLSARGGFHGLTLGALGVAGNDSYRDGFAVPADPRDRVPYGDIAALKTAFADAPERYAALLLEPLQGEAGIIDPPEGYLAEARALCDRYGALLVLDEVQSGLGRTGALFAAQHHGVIPDITTLAKALGGGLMPIGATLYNAAARNEAFGLRHSSTFAGGTLATAAGLAALDLLTRDDCAVLDKVTTTGAFLSARLRQLQDAFPEFIVGLSGRGLMQGIRLDFSSLATKPGLLGFLDEQSLTIHLVVSHLLNKGGVRLAPSFSAGNVLRIQPPLTVTPDELDPLFEALARTFTALRAGDTAEIFGHLIGTRDAPVGTRDAPVGTRRAPRLGTRPTSAPRPVKQGEGRFAFIVHPLSYADFARLDPALAGVADDRLRELVGRLARFIDPFPIETLTVEGADGARAHGELILVPHTPEALMQMSAAKASEEIGLAVDIARERGAKVVGLGGFSSIVAQGGMGLVRADRPALTSGNAYTSIIACQTVAHLLPVPPDKSHVAVIGAAGMVGRASALLAAQFAHRITLLGNPSRRSDLRARGQAVATELVAGLRVLHTVRTPGPGSVAEALARMGNLSDEAAALRLEAAGILIFAAPLEEAAPRADALIVATNSTERFLRSGHIKERALVCDVSRPFNVHPEVMEKRGDVRLIEGGLVRPERTVAGGTLAGPESETVFACAAETMLWALEQAYDRVHPQACMEPLRLLELADIGQKHGFAMDLAPMRRTF